MLWDIFCRVIDNFGDIGVCWRLARDLGQRGHAVRLWVDDASALAWMAPEVRWADVAGSIFQRGVGCPGVTVHHWAEAEALAGDESAQPGEVVIEAFGCEPPEAFIQRMQRPTPPAWINLEYLSAEPYVERCHGLPSPVSRGPGAGLVKRFFYPGFTPRTGGLLREPTLMASQDALSTDARMAWLHRLGVPATPGDALVSVFCYDQAPVGALLQQLQTHALGLTERTRVLLTPGHASQLAQAWADTGAWARPGSDNAPGLHLHHIPPLPQAEFDTLLWTCHLNLVRGEDSAVRALWAGRPHMWHIYPQDDGVHAEKLQAFMALWMQNWPAELRDSMSAWWAAWNGLTGHAGASGGSGDLSPALPPLPAWRDGATAWAQHSRLSREIALIQPDLCSQLIDFTHGFVTQPG